MRKIIPAKINPILFIFITLFFICGYCPIELCVNLRDYSENQKFIIVAYSEGTESFWSLIGDENGLFKDKSSIKPIHLTGNKPTRKYGDYIANSYYFICFADCAGEKAFLVNGSDENMAQYELYNVYDCKMLSPTDKKGSTHKLKLSDFIIKPKKYITIIDLIERDFDNADLEDKLVGELS